MISSPRRRLPVTVATTLTGAALALTACGGGGGKSAPSSSVPSSAPSSASSSSSAPAPAPGPATNPFTGIGGVPKHRVVVVKVDDSVNGRPQVNIDKADIVYIEAVEGGLTRLAAVFATTVPNQVGYVRSTRPSDPELLLQFGKITEAYSGGAHDSLPLLNRSGIQSWSNDAGRAYYSRQPHDNDHGYVNLVLDVAQVSAHIKTPYAQNIGWTFSPSIAGFRTSTGTDVRTVVTGSYSNGTAVEFRYDPKLKKYVRYIDGQRQYTAAGVPVATTNLIVQSCRVVSHPQDTDIAGNPSQYTFTVGSGPVSIFRGGKRIDGTWSRPGPKKGTTFTVNGKRIPLAPGNSWVVLIRKGVAVSG
ncbi:MAG: DUF3048 domain-containing protein [Jatrophihabitans sp.]|uniref:DUF3048 domain-containing protein n=1 Tax=Jatrophihabitans sp. TaxID=1932789 RepID=UPI003F7EC82A